MPQLKIGIQLASLKMPLKQALRIAAQLGAQAVEIDARGELQPRQLTQTGLRQLRKLLDDLNLQVCAVGFRTHRGYNVLDDLQPRLEATKDAMRFAYSLGAPVVVNHVGRIPADTADPDWDLLLAALTDLGRFGQHEGALLAAETGSESGQELARLIGALPAGSLGVNFDPGGLIVNGFSPLDDLHAVGAHVLHVHARDGVRDLAQGRGLEVPLGRGTADFPALLGVLEEKGYRGYFTIERETSPETVREISLAIEYLRNL